MYTKQNETLINPWRLLTKSKMFYISAVEYTVGRFIHKASIIYIYMQKKIILIIITNSSP